MLPSGGKATLRRGAEYPHASRRRHAPEVTSQTRTTLLSLSLEPAILPSGVNATHVMLAWCPGRVRRQAPEGTSHTCRVPSSLPETAIVPSRINATHVTTDVCPSSVRKHKGEGKE